MADPVGPFPLDPYRYDGPGDFETMDQGTLDALMEEAAGWVELRRRHGLQVDDDGGGVGG
jgi:hypothetical protein